MNTLRALLRACMAGVLTLGLFGLYAVFALPALLVGRLERWRARVQQLWSRALCALLGIRLVVQGPLPQGGSLLVANHLSYLDVLVLGSLLPCAFVSKAEVARWPVLGFLARAMGTFFVQRENKRALGERNAALQARLARGETLVLFPEGTSTPGTHVLPFRSALLQPAATLGLPVGYAALHYTTPRGAPPASEVVCWWGDMPFLPHLWVLLGLARIEAQLVFGAAPIVASDRKTLATRLQHAVTERLHPLLLHV